MGREEDRRYYAPRRQEGIPPRGYRSHTRFVHATAFVYALHMLHTAAEEVVKLSPEASGLQEVLAAFEASAEHLKDVRNSLAHREDRVRGLGRGGKPISPKPQMNVFVGDAAMILGPQLEGSLLGITTADGHYRRVAVSFDTLQAGQALTQASINSFPWEGMPRWSPQL